MQTILQSKIDWSGKYNRDGDPNHWAGAPIPVIKKDSEVYAALQDRRHALQVMLKPIAMSQLAALLYTLQGHYWQASMNETLIRKVNEDYARLLCKYPLSAFREVYDEILLQPDRRFMPAVGELAAMLEGKISRPSWELKNVMKLIERAE